MNAPYISVIIPTYNRPTNLGRCLDSLAVQTTDQGVFEVIVVNDGGIDVTDVIRTYPSFDTI